jgi:hypothetical protein
MEQLRSKGEKKWNAQLHLKNFGRVSQPSDVDCHSTAVWISKTASKGILPGTYEPRRDCARGSYSKTPHILNLGFINIYQLTLL